MIGRLFNLFGYEKRATEYDPRFTPENWGVARVPGTWTSPAAVLSNSAVACRAIDLKATLIASTPLKTYKRLPDGSRERVTDTALARVLDRPNDDMTHFDFFELLSRSLDLTGNFYARIVRAANGELEALYPIPSGSVTVERVPGSRRLRYRVSTGGEPSVLLDHEIMHVKNYSTDGLVGQSPISLARNALGLQINLAETAGNLASSGLRAAGFLSHPGKLTQSAKDNIAKGVSDGVSGPKGAGKIKVLEEGLTFVKTSFSSTDSELLESRKLSAHDCALIFGVPPGCPALGLSNTVSYGSAAQSALDLVQNTLNPLAARIEAAIEKALVTPESGLFPEFALDGLLRADPTTRWSTFRTAREIGAMSVEEIRAVENLGPKDPAHDYSPLRAAASAQTDPP